MIKSVRPIVLLAALGCAVLALALHAQDDPVLAVINDYVLRSSDVNAEIVQMPLGDQVAVRANIEKFAESLIQEEVLFQFALANQFGNDPALRKNIKELVVNHLIEQHVTSKLTVSEADIEQFYNNNTSAIRGETVQVRHILGESPAECLSLKTRVEAGEPFAELAKQYSRHRRSAEIGGELGSIMNHDGPLGFERELFNIAEDTATIFTSDEGCHVIIVRDRQTPPLPPLENVSAGIENLLMRQQEIAALQALMERAHSEVTVTRP